MSNLLLGLKNFTSQTVTTLGSINLGNVYRRYCKKNNCGIPTFSNTTTGVTLQQQGIYHITATAVGTGTTAGIVTITLLEDGVAIPSAFSSETITTPNTELRTFVIDTYVLVDSDCLLGRNTTVAKTLSLQNTGVDATFTSVVFNVEKVV
jgi:hypothetical protein